MHLMIVSEDLSADVLSLIQKIHFHSFETVQYQVDCRLRNSVPRAPVGGGGDEEELLLQLGGELQEEVLAVPPGPCLTDIRSVRCEE